MDALFRDGGLEAAFLAGSAFALVVWLLRDSLRIDWAVVAMFGVLVGYHVEDRITTGLVVALVLLAAAGIVSERIPVSTGSPLAKASPVLVGALIAVPGAIALAQEVSPDATTWMRTLLVVSVAVLPWLVLACSRRAPRATPLLVGITVAGILFCVPETGPLQAIVGAIIPAALLGFVIARPARAFAIAPLVGILVLTVIDGGLTRPGAVIGGMACFGLLVLPPIVARRSWWVIVPVDLVMVGYIARVPGLGQSARDAVFWSATAYALAIVILAVVTDVQRRMARAR
ncbi:MAG TPA: hypothetical protein VHS03_14110 [Gaiellaceae bacterium]|nr:hypothetical protein [Gaiellaceae bacterium]